MNKLLSKYLFYYPVTALRGEAVWKYLKEYEATQWESPEFLHDFQTKHLKKLLQHAFETVPYYRQLMIEKNLSIDDFQLLEQLNQLPITTKSDIVRFSDKIQSSKNFFLL